MHAHTLDYKAIGVQGTWVHTQEGETAAPDLPPGSFVMQPGKQLHGDACKGKQECIVFIHQHGKGDYIPKK
jgi:anti-sigma factor ChrR (cupin superfamily)